MDRKLTLLSAALCASAPAFGQGSDDCASAQAISGSGPFAYDTAGATTDGLPDPLCSFFSNDDIFDDVWFSWTAADSGDHILSLCSNTTGDSKIAVYAGACGSAPIACNDDSCSLVSELTFTATSGQMYLFRIGNFAAGGGSFGDLTVRLDAPILNPNNGHFYRLVNEQWSWTDARDQAEARLWQGQPGHLVTFENQAEIDWVIQNIAPARPWIGLFQNTASPSYAEPAGGWEWVTGEPATFFNWSSGEPNDTSASGGPEDYAEMFASGVWNDAELNHAQTFQYLVEWDGGSLGTNYCMANPNSTGNAGTIGAMGSLLIADNDLTLMGSDLPNQAFGFFLASRLQGFVPNPGGSAGNLCLGGAIGRYVGPGQIQNTGLTGEISLAIDLTQIPQPTGPVTALPGESWNFTAWHRDTSGMGAMSNFTDGLAVTFQ
ncbi:MAG: lectin-like protein [Planctomycetota bacterium]